jgi:hypothetical protein
VRNSERVGVFIVFLEFVEFFPFLVGGYAPGLPEEAAVNAVIVSATCPAWAAAVSGFNVSAT